MLKDKSSSKRIFKKILEWAGYVILAALWIFMVLAQLLPIPDAFVNDQWIRIGVLTGLLAFLFYFDIRILHGEKCSEAILEEFAELKAGIIRSGTFQDLFEAAMPTPYRVKELRIFALSTDKIFGAFRENDRHYRADKVLLLLHSSKKSEEKLKSWERLIPDRINELDRVWYDSTPSSYFVIFDRDCMFLGGYYPDDIPSGSYYIAPFLIRDSRIIADYIELHEKTMEFYKAKKKQEEKKQEEKK